ncbi:3-deoxy-D-manno-octulosonic acid transferase [Rhodoplanes sp. TEM]|uniref:3-deoxy-D-manno-octulosonic acid transferase n=1 Tax=Rhodoplanes tepidamans TaxID=200616 RepID=A0ABT5J4G1_RHOTP|nr:MULTISPECIES: 3-deoxy-D-manno-octulosonic acid transferase [Rhodoplanes]MDC7784531.1 3-deoxy-D-manno-octulosonic acid transferase [Rhodoplanes tepidamans]MDC7984438.1 3-deoxy-D-manno-octulosonic acid transferase [Rhodoplanes sp. TEM]MDQ0355759.1 3-deoxy-D-manno-octulosonic-acid transferase [Rhodoplanes tepidamans]
MVERLPFTFTAYRLATRAATPFARYLLARRLQRGKEHPERLAERRGEASAPRPRGPLVWVHGASVGELIAALPLVERLLAGGVAVLVTTGTVTSAEVAARRLPRGALHQFVPLDAPAYVARFLDHWRPDLGLFVESDLWPNLILGCGERGIPLILTNGRLSERSFEKWQRAPATIEALLSRFDLCLVRSAEDAQRFGALGAPRIGVTGNLKLDVPALPVDPGRFAELKRALAGRPLVVAASTHAGEEAVLIEVHRRLRLDFPRLLTVIAPRHPERGAEIAALARAASLDATRRAEGLLPNAATEIYVSDTLGELGLLYRLAPVVFMGGSLIPHGGQNPIEPIKLGAGVLHGPHVKNFSDLYQTLDSAGGALQVRDGADLARRLAALLADPEASARLAAAGERTVQILAGAVDRTMAALEPYLVQIRLAGRSDYA